MQISGIISLASDFNVSLDGLVHSDSIAAIGIVHRTGLGGRHLSDGCPTGKATVKRHSDILEL